MFASPHVAEGSRKTNERAEEKEKGGRMKRWVFRRKRSWRKVAQKTKEKTGREGGWRQIGIAVEKVSCLFCTSP